MYKETPAQDDSFVEWRLCGRESNAYKLSGGSKVHYLKVYKHMI